MVQCVYSAGRPSHWASAHILVVLILIIVNKNITATNVSHINMQATLILTFPSQFCHHTQ